MSALRSHISVSLDGFAAGPNQSPEHPLGVHEWAYGASTWREQHGLEGGEHSAEAEVAGGVAWDMPPFFSLRGKAAFDGAIEHDGSPGLPDIRLTRLVEEGDLVVAEGSVRAAPAGGGEIDAPFCDVFEFRGDEICRLATYQVDRQPGDATRRAFEA